MAEGNGAHKWEEEMRHRMEALEKAHKELEDSFIVMTHLETKMSQMLKHQAEFLPSHDKQLEELRERDRVIDDRIDKFVSGIGELIRRNPRVV